ncbi:hypothetical protein INT43_003636 [Umbelopsis isabellina]|uniref:Autophagy-related protein 16 domain-containing protein n=1 Tax=Mortierella isabellina TaxID=91625 RepID=A0A8H7PU92_MORIS|nr:hypothetical protein INT43_003636 [Umbelopsis isabellina]
MQQETLRLKEEIQRLKNEQTEMYKTQGQNAQRLVDMNDKLRAHEAAEKEANQKIESVSEELKLTTAKVEQQAHLLKQKDVAIQVLQDELSTLQLEFSTTEEKNKQLFKENSELVQRWLKKMNEEAEKMNEATMFYESLAEQAKNSDSSKASNRWMFRSKSSENDNEKMKRIQDIPLRISMVTLPKQPAQVQNIPDGEIHCIKSSPTGNSFAVGGSDRKVRIYSVRQGGTLTQTLSGSLQTLTSVRFNEGEDLLLGSSMDNSTRIWDLTTGRIRHTLTGHIGKVCSAEFTSDSNRVVSGSQDRTLKLWDLHKGYCTRTIFTFSSCNDVCLIDHEGSSIASGHLDNNVRLWDTRTGNGIKELTGLHSGQVTSISVSPDGSKLLTNSRDNTLHIVDLRMYKVIRTFKDDSYRNGLNWSRACFSPDGHYAAAGSATGTIHFWNTMTGKHESAVQGHKQAICAVDWSPIGAHLFSADRSKSICIWDTSTQL